VSDRQGRNSLRPIRAKITAMAATRWDPAQYNRFAGEREQPFWDLAALVEQNDEQPELVDLGCGDGRLTDALAMQFDARHALGVDSSSAMLERAAAHVRDGLEFTSGDLATWTGSGVDVVFSNAALHWVPDHAAVLARWRDALRDRGQVAVQIPSNADHPSHRISRELAEEWLSSDAPSDPVDANVLPPERYAEVLDALGFTRQHVRLQVYSHHLASTADVVEWTRGSSLTRFSAVFDDTELERFVDEYRRRLLAELGDSSPYLYTFKRTLLWGRLA
jgi:trans-aconitate 2-methyltransferase